jgi:hypothetical protein
MSLSRFQSSERSTITYDTICRKRKCNEIMEAMKWDHITTKVTLIDEIKRSVKKIEKENVLHFVRDFTV